MRTAYLVAVLWCLFSSQMSNAASVKDKRLAPITSNGLKKLMLSTPLSSPLHELLLLRASHSHLMDLAYDQYTLLWQQHPDNASANLLRGIVAEYLASDSMEPGWQHLYSKVPKQTLFPIAAMCLAKAVKLAPDSASANREDGFFQWQFEEKVPEGLAHLKKALQLAPNEPRTHTMWGNVYANPGGSVYNLHKAATQLELSVKLDPTYAFTHSLLASVYSRIGQPERAERERQIYHSLLP